MALYIMSILCVVVLVCFVATSIFMFKPNGNKTVHNISYWLAIVLGVAVTVINATALPSNMTLNMVLAWLGLLFAVASIIIKFVKGNSNNLAKILAMICTVYGCIWFFV